MSHRLYYNLFWDNNQNVCVLCKGERYTGFSLLFCDNHIINWIADIFGQKKSQKLTKKAKKIYLADFGQQYQQKIEKKKTEKLELAAPYGWRSLKSKHQNLALNSLNVQASQQCLAPSASKSNIISYNHQNTCRLRMDF